jgi:hypothetical protein
MKVIGAKRALVMTMMSVGMMAAAQPATAQKYFARQQLAPKAQAAVTYSWQAGTTDAGCSVKYGRRALVSSATCKGSDGSTASDSSCTSAKPASAATTYGATCTTTVDCATQTQSNRSGIQTETYYSFTASTTSAGQTECARILNDNHRLGTCTYEGGTSWRVFIQTTGTQAASGQTAWSCQPGVGSVP